MAASHTKQNNPQDGQHFQNPHKGSKAQQKASSPASRPITGNASPDYAGDLDTDENSNKYDSENPRNEPGPQCKDITEKDTQGGPNRGCPIGGSQKDKDTQNSSEVQNDSFETI